MVWPEYPRYLPHLDRHGNHRWVGWIGGSAIAGLGGVKKFIPEQKPIFLRPTQRLLVPIGKNTCQPEVHCAVVEIDCLKTMVR